MRSSSDLLASSKKGSSASVNKNERIKDYRNGHRNVESKSVIDRELSPLGRQ